MSVDIICMYIHTQMHAYTHVCYVKSNCVPKEAILDSLGDGC